MGTWAFIAIAALLGGVVFGGLAGCVLYGASLLTEPTPADYDKCFTDLAVHDECMTEMTEREVFGRDK